MGDDVVELQVRELHGSKSRGVDKNFPSGRVPEIGDDLVWDQGERKESFVVMEVSICLPRGKKPAWSSLRNLGFETVSSPQRPCYPVDHAARFIS